MKRCPLCGSTFRGSGKFCPHDGTPLDPLHDASESVLHGVVRLDRLASRTPFGERYVGRLVDGEQPVRVSVLRDLRDARAAEARLEATKRALGAPLPRSLSPIYGWELDRKPAYVLEASLGLTSLEAALTQGGSIPWERALRIACSMARVLEWMHECGVTHGFLTPGAIRADTFEAPSGQLRLADWALGAIYAGQSIRVDAPPPAHADYLAPEIAQGGEPGPAADVYALGLVLYEMISGHPPFTGATPLERMQRRLHESAPAPDGVPPGFGDLYEVVTSPDPAGRLQSMNAFVNAAASFFRDGTNSGDFPSVSRRQVATSEPSEGASRTAPYVPIDEEEERESEASQSEASQSEARETVMLVAEDVQRALATDRSAVSKTSVLARDFSQPSEPLIEPEPEPEPEPAKELAPPSRPSEPLTLPTSPPDEERGEEGDEDEVWFRGNAEETWDQEVYREHSAAQDRRVRMILWAALGLFLTALLAAGVYVLFIYEPIPDEEAALQRGEPPARFAERAIDSRGGGLGLSQDRFLERLPVDRA